MVSPQSEAMAPRRPESLMHFTEGSLGDPKPCSLARVSGAPQPFLFCEGWWPSGFCLLFRSGSVSSLPSFVHAGVWPWCPNGVFLPFWFLPAVGFSTTRWCHIHALCLFFGARGFESFGAVGPWAKLHSVSHQQNSPDGDIQRDSGVSSLDPYLWHMFWVRCPKKPRKKRQ